LSLLQTSVLSLVMFTGGSQFALVGLTDSPVAGVGSALLLGSRNALYGLRLTPLLRLRGLRRVPAAHLVLDESTAMAISQRDPRRARLAFYATGVAVYLCWNVATVVGAVGAEAVGDPDTLGLDAAGPAAFVALLAPRVRGRAPWLVAAGAGAVALVTAPLLPAGAPVLLAAAVAVAAIRSRG
jgi:predicted branched-subunit amino acid permease